MYGHSVPSTLDGFLNTVAYAIEVPEYAFDRPHVIQDGELESFRTIDKNAMVLSRVPIGMMIDFCDRVIPFKIIQADDILEIYRYLGEYIRQLEEFNDIPEAADYLGKSKRFHEKLTRSINIISKRNPEALKLLNNNTLVNLFK